MVLANNDEESDHLFLYARVFGIFHANVIYTGSVNGAVNYRPHTHHFLWVRWFELDPKAAEGGWGSSLLDRVVFPPMENKDAFDFLDPADVLRGCHIIPSFRSGKRFTDRRGLSGRANDSEDWRSYCINRQVDCMATICLYCADCVSAID